MSDQQVKEYCKRTGQMEKLAPRDEPKKEYRAMTVEEIGIEIKEMKPTKFGNIPTEVNGIMFQSKKEAQYYVQLLMLQRGGVVKDIKLQPRYLLQEKFKKNGKNYRAIEYVSDFETTYSDGHIEIVDTKGVKTKEFLIKQKMFEYKYPDKTIIIV
jgi:hypothetical protein